MASIKVRPLRDDLSFGVRVTGMTEAHTKDRASARQINDSSTTAA